MSKFSAIALQVINEANSNKTLQEKLPIVEKTLNDWYEQTTKIPREKNNMLHTLGQGTWEVQASFDGTEILIFYGENNNNIAFRMDDDHSRAVMMHWISQHLQLKRLVDIGTNKDQPPTPHTSQGEEHES